MNIVYSKIYGNKGPDLLILHGFLGMGGNWNQQAKMLELIGFRVHLVDQRNHGRSFWSNEFSYTHMAEDILEYCRHKKLNKIFVLGHSMGGKTAMFLACKYPDLLRGFIIADIAPKKYEPAHHKILHSLSLLNSNKISSRLEADLLLANQIKDPNTRNFLLKNLYRLEDGTLGLRININILKHSNDLISEGLKPSMNSKVPCLFLKAENSDYILSSDYPSIRHHFPYADYDLIPNVGHWLHAENPKLFFNFIRLWFLKQI